MRTDVGASGSIYGLLLVGLAAVLVNRRSIPYSTPIMMAYSIAITLEVLNGINENATGTAVVGHGFGALVGFLAGLALVRRGHHTDTPHHLAAPRANGPWVRTRQARPSRDRPPRRPGNPVLRDSKTGMTSEMQQVV